MYVYIYIYTHSKAQICLDHEIEIVFNIFFSEQRDQIKEQQWHRPNILTWLINYLYSYIFLKNCLFYII